MHRPTLAPTDPIRRALWHPAWVDPDLTTASRPVLGAGKAFTSCRGGGGASFSGCGGAHGGGVLDSLVVKRATAATRCPSR